MWSSTTYRFCRITLLATAAAALGGTPSAEQARPSSSISPPAFEAHVEYLAHDLLEGREAGTRGYDLAAGYVASHFRQFGLEPAGHVGSYFQPVPLQTHRIVRDRARLVVRPRGGNPQSLVVGEDFGMRMSFSHAEAALEADAVFVGYGIDAPAFGHDDYAGLDVRGKVVVSLPGYPPDWPAEEGAHLSSSARASAAAERGAVGIITIYSQWYEQLYPWSVAKGAIDSTGMAWIGPDGRPNDPAPSVQLHALVSPEISSLLFAGAPRSYEQIRDEATSGAPKGFPLAVRIEMAGAAEAGRLTSANVAGLLRGSDPALRDEVVVLLAHLDHVGIGAPINGDAIYNGALDNAAGIAALLEAARTLGARPERPRRSVLFLAVTAEEKGLVGSDYFARHGAAGGTEVVAAVNLDMPVLRYRFTDVVAYGAQHSSIGPILESTVEELGLTLTPDPIPEQVLFVRSDQYSFVRVGVPAVFLATGWHSADGAGAGGKAFQQFLATDYHKPSDDPTQPIDYEAGALFTEVNIRLLEAIANADRRPSWNDGSFFGTLSRETQ